LFHLVGLLVEKEQYWYPLHQQLRLEKLQTHHQWVRSEKVRRTAHP
jgi:hypothetical protein